MSSHPRDFRPGWDKQTKHSRCIIEFYTWSENGPSGRTDDARVRAIVGSPIRVQTSKHFGAASGTFTITMKKPEQVSEYDYQTMWRDPEGVWVRISWQCDDAVIEGMFGAVDTINSTLVRSEHGTRDETYEIHGRDFGKVFEDTSLFINVLAKIQVGSFAFVHETLAPQVLGVTPAVFVTKLIDAWIGNNESSSQAWELPAGLKDYGDTFYAMLSYAGVQDMTDEENGITSDPRLLDPAQDGTPLWDALQHYSNGVLNELWLDLAPPPSKPFALTGLVPTVFLRERPFRTRESEDAWRLVQGWTLERGDVQQRQIAKGGSAARYNYWLLVPTGGDIDGDLRGELQAGGDGAPGDAPIIDLKSIARYGLRKWEQTTLFRAVRTDKSNASMIDLAKAWLQKLHDWHSITPMQFSGQLTTSRLYPEIRIGHKLREEIAEGVLEYYIEGVDNSWSYPGTGQTVLTVTRGQFEGDNLLDLVYHERAEQDLPAAVGERDPIDENTE